MQNRKWQSLITALIVLAVVVALGIISCPARAADVPLLSAKRVQFGPTAIYEFRGTGTSLIPSHKMEPALGVSLSYTLSSNPEKGTGWAVAGTVARWLVPLGGAPAENYANIKLTWIAFNGDKR